MNLRKVVDSHTHSEFSHDSVCKIKDMYKAEKERGVLGFTVTDHFDMEDFTDESSLERIGESVKTAKSLDKSDFRVFSGVEIGAGARNPALHKKVAEAFDYDIVLGSVHRLEFGGKIMGVSNTDFSCWEENDLYILMDSYYAEILNMLSTCEFDVLTHLNYPIRYITLKSGRKIDISRYDEKVDEIFKELLKRDIPLEINTAKIEFELTPSEKYIRRYFELGGRKITLASDAHVTENASKGFEKAIQTLKDIGFKKALYFEKRKPVEYDL